MDIVQTFYDNLASEYDLLFLDWNSATNEQAKILDKLIASNGFDASCRLLDCACGIGTQAIGLASIGYKVTASDISENELAEARKRAIERQVTVSFNRTDFRALSKTFSEQFDIIIAMDNALPHMLSATDLNNAVKSITNQLADGGIFVASIRDYDEILKTKPSYSPPYVHSTDSGQRISFQTWSWNNNNYKLVQYIINDDGNIKTSKFECEYRAVTRAELTDLLLKNGCSKVEWKFPDETGFYQPIVIAKK